MIKRIIPALTVLTMFLNCIPTNNKAVPDKTAKEIFNPSELEGIEKMIMFVDEIVLNNTNETDINQAYHTYFQNLETYITHDKMFPAFVKDSVKFKFFERLNKEAVDAIWQINNHIKRVKYKDTTLTDVQITSLELNINGSYLDYLEQIGKSDSVYDDLNNCFRVCGDISPTAVCGFLIAYKDYDFKIFKNRLWATVFLLRMGDPLEEKVERYLKERNSTQNYSSEKVL